MTEQTANVAYRLRAIVRAAMSPGVWLAVAAQLVYPLLHQGGFFDAERFSIGLVSMALAAIVMTVLYLQSGVLAALTRGDRVVTLREALAGGIEVFPSFLWLMLKASLLIGLGMGILLTLMLTAAGESPQSMASQSERPLGIMLALMPAILVWWMPGAFVYREFALFPSLRRAGRELTRDIGRTVFPLALVLGPTLVLTLLPADATGAAALMLQAAGVFLVWVANVYCIEHLKSASAGPQGA